MQNIGSMALKVAMRVGMAMGIKSAIKWISSKSASTSTTPVSPGQINDARAAAKRARQAARITRRGL